MFPLPFNIPFRKKDGTLSTLGDELNNGGGGGSYTLPTASADTKGGVKIGVGLEMDGEVLKNTNPTPATPYTLPIASDETLGGIKVGSNLTIEEDGTLNASGGGSAYELPTASGSTKGGVKIGEGLISIVNNPNSADNEKLFVRLGYNTKPITSYLSTLGGTITQVASKDYKILGISVCLSAKSGATLPDIKCRAHAQKNYNANYWSIVFEMIPTDTSITDLTNYIDTSQSYVGVIYYKESY